MPTSLLMLLCACIDIGSDDTAAVGSSYSNVGPLDCTQGYYSNLFGPITDDLVLTADQAYLLHGDVVVGDDMNQTTLTIEAGTTLCGEASTNGKLVISRGSKLYAEGTAEAPIVFTSAQEVGSRARGDWGGLVINGRAPINACDTGNNTVCEAEGEGGTGWYGGNNPNDDSGVLRYVRVEFAGMPSSPDHNLNGMAFHGVGSGTTIDHIQVHMSAGDGVAFVGGTAQARHVVVTGASDDGLDWSNGWQGKAQFVVVQQHGGSGDNGIEADNNSVNHDAEPRSTPTLSNVTVIGSPNAKIAGFGVLLRAGTAGALSNVLMTSFRGACLDVDDDSTWSQTSTGALSLNHSLVDCATNFRENQNEMSSVEEWFQMQHGNIADQAMLGDPTNKRDPGWVPSNSSPALGSGQAPSDGFFEPVDYIGAFGSTDWTEGWISTAID